jgi:hypothetical protein
LAADPDSDLGVHSGFAIEPGVGFDSAVEPGERVTEGQQVASAIVEYGAEALGYGIGGVVEGSLDSFVAVLDLIVLGMRPECQHSD